MKEKYTQNPTVHTNIPLTTPVLFLIFNRPENTEQVFSALKKTHPTKLYIAADGPRSGNSKEAKDCERARSIATNVNWDCEVKTLFRGHNLGCRLAVSQAIDWFFEQESEGIILEDDCLPDQSFFWFCKELLEKYRNDTRIMHIGGTNFQFGKNRTNYSYYFSRYAHIWGWASWRRAWEYYDEKLKKWPEADKNGMLLHLTNKQQFINYWEKIFDNTASGEIDTWDYQWTFACWSQNGLSIVPSVNLVTNIGFSTEGTHTKKVSQISNMSANTISIPLVHPKMVTSHFKADTFVEYQQFSRPLIFRLFQKLERSFTRLFK